MIDKQAVAAALEVALEVVNEVDPPDDLRSVAFERAFEALSPVRGDVPMQGNGASSATAMPAHASEKIRGGVERAAAKLRVPAETIQRVVELDDDGVHLMVPRSRFPKLKSVAIQEVATLVVGMRQASGLEEWTPLGLVRQATEELGVEDPSNFAAHIRRLEGVRPQGSGRTGQLKMNAVGFERTAAVVTRLAEAA